MLMTGDGVFFAQTWHKSNLPPPRALFFLRWHFGGGQKLPLIIPPTGPNPSTGSIQLPRRLFLPTSTTNNKKYTLSGWSHQWTTRLLREALSELCKRAPDGHDDSKSHGTLPYPNVQTTVSKSWSDPLTRVGKPDGQAQPMS